MRPLRNLSWRPEILVDHHGARLQDPTDGSQVGIAGPLGRERVVFALPLNQTGPVQIAPHEWLRDEDSSQVADTSSAIVGRSAGLWISRLVYAYWTEDTRRL